MGMEAFPYDLPDPDDMSEDSINDYYAKYSSMDPEKGDKDNEVSQQELDAIDRFLKDFDNQNYPYNGPEDFI